MTSLRSLFQRVIQRLPVELGDDEQTQAVLKAVGRFDPRLVIAGGGLLAAVVGLAVAQQGMLAVAVMLALLVAIISFVKPDVGLFCFALMMYSRASENLTLTFGVPSIAPLFAVFLLTVLVIRDGFGALWRSRLAYWSALSAYGLVLLASVLVAVDPDVAFTAVIDYTRELIFILVIVLYTRSIGSLRVLVWGFLLGGLIPALLTIYQAISGSTFAFYGFGQNVAQIVVPGQIQEVPRPSGHVGDANFYALALIPLVPLAIHRFRYESSRWVRQIALLSVVALGVAIMLTYSRGGYLALGIVLITLAVTGFFRLRILVIAGLIGLLVLPFLPSQYSDRVTSLADLATTAFRSDSTEQSPSAEDASVSGRRGEVLAGIYMFRDHPLLGVGVRNYPEHYQEYGRSIGIERRSQRSAHSLYVEIAAETGVFGLLAFGGLVLSLFLWLRRVWSATVQPTELRDLARILAIALLGYLVASVFLHAGYPRFLWMMAAASLAASDIAFERRTRRASVRLQPIRPLPVPISPVDPRRARFWMGTAAMAGALLVSVATANIVLGRNGIDLIPARASETPALDGTPATPDATAPAATATPTLPARQPVTPTPLAPSDASALTDALEAQSELTGCRWFAETQHNICDSIQAFWETNGGLPMFGYPLTELFEFDGVPTQYFERARFEVGQDDDGSAVVRIAELGSASMLARIGVEQYPPTVPIDDQPDCVFEDQTGHNVCGRFAYFWVAYGGVDVFGLPISEELEEDGTRVQYFQYARLEYAANSAPDDFDIRLGLVGVEDLDRLKDAR